MQRHIKRLLAGKQRFLWLIAIGYTLMITYVFLMPPTGAQTPFPQADKLVHLLIFLILILVWELTVYYPTKSIRFREEMSLLLAALLYGIVIEALQGLFIVGRQPDVLDVIANVTGSIIGLLCFRFLQERVLK